MSFTYYYFIVFKKSLKELVPNKSKFFKGFFVALLIPVFTVVYLHYNSNVDLAEEELIIQQITFGFLVTSFFLLFIYHLLLLLFYCITNKLKVLALLNQLESIKTKKKTAKDYLLLADDISKFLSEYLSERPAGTHDSTYTKS